jgi:lipopolysaccharide export system permease protein
VENQRFESRFEIESTQRALGDRSLLCFNPMKILSRSCLLSLLPPFFLAVLSTQFFLNLAFYLLDFLDYLLRYRIGWGPSLKLLLYIQPSFLVLALPISFLFALLTVMGRQAADRELIALETCGFSGWVLAVPLMVTGLMGSLFMVFFMNRVLPWGNTSFIKLQYQIVSERSSVALKERVFIKDFPGFELYFDRMQPGGEKLNNVQVNVLNSSGKPHKTLLAPLGILRRDPKSFNVVLELHDGTLQQLGWNEKDGSGVEKILLMDFEVCSLNLDIRRHSDVGIADFTGANNISSGDLSKRIRIKKAKGEDTCEDEIGLQKKFSIPFATMAFTLIAIPLGFRARSGSVVGMVLAVLLVLAYYLILLGNETLAQTGKLSPFSAMWLPNFILGGFGALLLIRVIRWPTSLPPFGRRSAS